MEKMNTPRERRKGYVARDRRGNVIFFVSVVLVAAIVVAILALLPGRFVRIGGRKNGGVGRHEMFPFVFQNEEGMLYVIPDSDLDVREIDDSVSQSVCDAAQNHVYYTRNGILYRYDVKANTRMEILQEVRDFILTDQRKVIYYADRNGRLKYYNGTASGVLSEKQDVLPEQYYVCNGSRLLFLEDYKKEDGSARLCLANADGSVKRYDVRINGDKLFSFNQSGNRICFYQGNEFCIMSEQGKILTRIDGGTAVTNTVQASLVSGSTQYVTYSKHTTDRYIVIGGQDNQSKLVYFNGSKIREIAKDIKQILYYSEERDMILFTVTQNDGSVKVYQSVEGGRADAQLSCRPDTKFFFDSQSDYLYYQLFDGTLHRYNIYDVNRKSVKVSSNTGLIYQYPNKPFVGFESKDGEQMYLVHSDNSIRQYDWKQEVQLYGLRDERYFLLRTYGNNRISLDYVQGTEMTRISGDVGQQVFFDEKMSVVLYTSGEQLYAWNKVNTTEIGSFGRISAVPVVL